MFALLLSAVTVVTVVTVVAIIIYNTIAAKNVDITYYEKQMYKYMRLLDAEVASNIQLLKDKDVLIEQKDVDMAYYAKEMHNYMTLFDAEVASKAKLLKQKDADISYYEKQLAYAEDHLKAAIDSKMEEIDYYRRRGNAIAF